jgi:arylsulfatase A-like enzyme
MDKPARKPNVIWIVSDQHRAQALSCMGDPNVNTPHIDLMAAYGICSTGAVAGTPLCCPFRGSMLTGRYPHQCVPGHEYQMPPEQPTVAHAFRQAGYHTAYFGKWHVDGFHERDGRAAMHIVPPQRRGGFDTWYGYENNNSQWDSWVHGGENGATASHKLEGYETDALTEMLLDYIGGRKRPEVIDQPFFAVLSVQPPHDPYTAPPEYMARHNPATLKLRPNVPDIPAIQQRARRELAGAYAMIENLDWNIGRIRQSLRGLGLEESTFILFFSDHGDMHGSHGQLRKTSPWEEAIRIPFIMTGPVSLYGHGSGFQNLLINHVDIAPTSLGLCGIAKPSHMAGTDYSPAWHRKPIPNEPDSAFLQLCVSTGHAYAIDRPWRGIVTRDGWKYIVLEGQPMMMHNLNEDPYEQVNLAFNTAHKGQRKRLQDRLGQWIADTGDQFQLPQI